MRFRSLTLCCVVVGANGCGGKARSSGSGDAPPGSIDGLPTPACTLAACSASVVFPSDGEGLYLDSSTDLLGLDHLRLSGDGKVIVGTQWDRGVFRWSRESGRVWLYLWEQFDGAQWDGHVVTTLDGATVYYSVSQTHDAGGTEYASYRWSDSTGAEPFDEMMVLDVSSDGSTLLGTECPPSDPCVPVLRSAAGSYPVSMVDLISGNGQRAAGTAPESYAFLWSMEDRYQTFPKTEDGAQATDIDYEGSVVVGYEYSYASRLYFAHAFRWTATEGYQQIDMGAASAVSGDGSIVVGASNAEERRPMIWTERDGGRFLDDIVHEAGIDLQGTSLASVVDISLDGRVMIGTANTPDGAHPMYMLKLP